MNIIYSISPIILLLIALLYLDSFKLVKVKLLLLLILYGIVTAVMAYYINSFFYNEFELTDNIYRNIVAPLNEEFLKLLIIPFLIARNKIGFMIDAAIYGFAIGTGFALAENIYYLNILDSNNPLLWLIRGIGTATMHGGTIAIASILLINQYEKNNKLKLMVILVVFLFAVLLHSFFNIFMFPPSINTILYFTIITVLLIFCFNFNEKRMRNWFDIQLDSESKLLNEINAGKFSDSKSGKYFLSIKTQYSPEIVVDMLAYVKLYLELSIKAKGIMLMKENGFDIPYDEELQGKLTELKILEKNIGKTAIWSLAPILRMSKKDIWKMRVLE